MKYAFILLTMLSVVFAVKAMEIPVFMQRGIINVPSAKIKKISFSPVLSDNPLLAIHYHRPADETEGIAVAFPAKNMDRWNFLGYLQKAIVGQSWDTTGKLFAVLFNDGVLQIWDIVDINDKNLLHEQSFPKMPRGLCFHPCKQQLVVAFDDELQFFSTAIISDSESIENTKEKMPEILTLKFQACLNEQVVLQFNSAGTLLLCGAYVIDVIGQRVIDFIDDIVPQDAAFANDFSKKCAQWNPISDRIAIKKADEPSDQIYFFEPDSYSYIAAKGHIEDLQWSPDGKFLAVSRSDRSISLLNAAGDKIVTTLRSPNACSYLTWSPDGRHFAASDGDVVTIWAVKESTPVNKDVELLDPITCPGLENPEFSYIKALLYSCTSCIEPSKRKITLSSIKKVFIENKDSIMVPTLLLLHAFWQKRNDAVKATAFEYLHKTAKSIMKTDQIAAHDLMMLIFDQLSQQKEHDQLFEHFNIELKYNTFCITCNKRSNLLESTSMISLIPQESIPLEKLLHAYFTNKIRLDHTCKHCRTSGVTAFKPILSAPPKTILIHLNRFFIVNDILYCNDYTCSLPLDHLNISQFGNFISDGDSYYLKAIVAISKDLSKQRYKTYVRNGKFWVCYYKGTPKKVAQEKIDSFTTLSPKTKCFIPTLLFYQRENA